MARIKDAENAQTVAEMKQRIADLEIQVRSWPNYQLERTYTRTCDKVEVEPNNYTRQNCYL